MNKECRNKTCRWYIEPKDEFTNGVLFNEGALDTSEITMEGNNTLKVWEVPNYSFIVKIIKSSKTLPLKFKVYSKEGKGGKIRLSKLPFLKKKS